MFGCRASTRSFLSQLMLFCRETDVGLAALTVPVGGGGGGGGGGRVPDPAAVEPSSLRQKHTKQANQLKRLEKRPSDPKFSSE